MLYLVSLCNYTNEAKVYKPLKAYCIVPRINIELPDALHRRCKLAAITRGKTLKAFLTEELEQAL